MKFDGVKELQGTLKTSRIFGIKLTSLLKNLIATQNPLRRIYKKDGKLNAVTVPIKRVPPLPSPPRQYQMMIIILYG